MRASVRDVLKTTAVVVVASAASTAALLAAPPATKYNLGETLAPTCAPGSTNCTVVAPAASGVNTDITSLTGLTSLGIAQTDTTFADGTYQTMQTVQTLNPGGAQSINVEHTAVVGKSTIDAANTNSIGYATGIAGTAENNGTGSILGVLFGITAVAQNNAAAAVNGLYAIWASADNQAGSVTYQAGAYIDPSVGGGTVTNLYGVQTGGMGITGGSVTNRYGVFIGNPVGSTTTGDWGLYQESTSQKNYFGGKVGIGLTTPSELLEAQGADADINLTTFDNTNSDNSTLHLRFARGTAGAPAVVSDGDVIGEIKGVLYNGSSYSEVTDIVHAADCVIGSDKCGALSFRTRPAGGSAPVTRMKIKANGFIGIGTSTPDDALVEVKGGTVCVDTNNDGSATSCIASESDERLKKNIQPIEGALDKIMQLRGVTFDWRWDEFPEIKRYQGKPHDMGIIAQEVEKVFPEALGEELNGYKTVDYRLLVAPLIEATKELKNEVDTLKAFVCDEHPGFDYCKTP